MPRHIRKELSRFEPHPANNRLKAWRGFTRWLVDVGRLDTDPAREVRKPKIPESDGFTAATWEDALAFRRHWPVGTGQRMALEVILRTGASIGDMCRLGSHMVEDGWLSYERGKSGSMAMIPWEHPPAWARGDELDACLGGHRHLLFLVTATGKPRSEKAAAAWFSHACTEAGLPHLSAQSFRKLKAARMKELGATPEQRMAILGHDTKAEASRDAKSADLRKVISGTSLHARLSNFCPTPRKQ
jgi:integrase